jgi:hypothetical protein
VKTFRELVATSRTPPWSIQILAPDRAKAAKEAAALERLDVVDRVVDIDRFVPENQDAKQVVLDDMLLTLGPTLLEIQPVAPPTKAEVLEAARKLQQRLEAHEARVGRDPGATSLAARLGALREAVGAASGDALLADLTHRLLDTLPLTLGRLDRALRTRPFSEGDLPPSLRREWVGADGAVRLEVFPTEDLGAIPALRRFVRAVRGVVPRATGAPVTILASGEAIVAAFRQALVGSVAACTLILIVLLRRPSRVLLVLVPLVFAGFATGAATVLFSMPFNYANVIALPLLFGIGVDSGIHVVHRSEGVLPASAGGNPMRTSTGRAVVFSAITTICSFGSLAFSPHPGTASMGRLLAIGVLTTLFATLWLLPALVLGARRPGEGDSPRGEAARVS